MRGTSAAPLRTAVILLDEHVSTGVLCTGGTNVHTHAKIQVGDKDRDKDRVCQINKNDCTKIQTYGHTDIHTNKVVFRKCSSKCCQQISPIIIQQLVPSL